jgi:hypothetical protein
LHLRQAGEVLKVGDLVAALEIQRLQLMQGGQILEAGVADLLAVAEVKRPPPALNVDASANDVQRGVF